MLRKRRVFAVEPLWKRDGSWRPAEDGVVLTSISMFRKLQDPQPEVPLRPELDGKLTSQEDRWGEAGSLTDPAPCQLSFLPTSGRLLKSESEDSGVEMASNDHSPSTPVGSEKSFSLDCLEGFQPVMEDSPPTAPHQSCLSEEEEEEEEEEEPEDLGGPAQDRVYHRNLSVSKKLAQVMQRSQKRRLLSRSPRPLAQKPPSRVDLGGLKPYRLHQTLALDWDIDLDTGGHCEPLSDSSTPEEPSKEEEEEEEVHSGTALSMPGQGLRYLEHICQMLEKIALLQQANLQLQHQQQVMECRIRAQEAEKEDHPEEPSGLTGEEPQPKDPVSPKMVEEKEDPHPVGPLHPPPFRARSASDTRFVRNPARRPGKEANPSRKSAGHTASSPSLLDQLDGGSQTLPPGMKLKNGHSHWGRVKGLINRITRKSVRSSEAALPGDLSLGYRKCRSDTVLDKHEPHPRWRFLPTLGVKKHGSKHLPMR